MLLPLVPGIRPASNAGKAKGPQLKALVDKTLQRDQQTCRFCGFKAGRYQRTVPWQGAKNPPPDTGLVTACTFCEQCVAMERAGITGAGILIWLPEIAQADLNHIARAIYIARANKDKHTSSPAANASGLANRAFDALVARRTEAKKRLGTDDPMVLTTAMHEQLDNDERAGVANKIDGIRILPAEKHMIRGPQGDANHMPAMIRYWISDQGPFAKMPVESWASLFKDASSKAGHA